MTPKALKYTTVSFHYSEQSDGGAWEFLIRLSPQSVQISSVTLKYRVTVVE